MPREEAARGVAGDDVGVDGHLELVADGVAGLDAVDRLAVLGVRLAADVVRDAGRGHQVALVGGVDEHPAAVGLAAERPDRDDPRPLLRRRRSSRSSHSSTNGGNGYGTIFKISPTGVLTTLHAFCTLPPYCADGGQPWAPLVEGTDGNFYGATVEYGANHGGTIFKITPKGALTTLFSFCDHSSSCTDGYAPVAGLVEGNDGNFYGTTPRGGNNSCQPGYGCGTIFKISPNGALTTLHSFEGSDGIAPYGLLIQGTDGDFYGTTTGGGNVLLRRTPAVARSLELKLEVLSHRCIPSAFSPAVPMGAPPQLD